MEVVSAIFFFLRNPSFSNLYTVMNMKYTSILVDLYYEFLNVYNKFKLNLVDNGPSQMI